MSGAMQRVSEFFLLEDLKERSAAIAPEERERGAAVYARVRQKRDAAEALWTAGFPAEALRLATEARDAIRAEAPTDDRPATPALDSEIKPEHAEQFRALQHETTTLLDAQFGKWLDATAIRKLQLNRIAMASAIGVALLAAIVFLVRTPRILKAEASGQWDPRYDAGKAVDGSERTDWLLPDRTLGWIDLHVQPRRKLKRLHVTNARNVPYNDRGTNEFHVEVFDGGQLVKQFDGKFDGFSAEPVTRTFDIDAQADRIKITVKSHYLTGAGFAEISVDD